MVTDTCNFPYDYLVIATGCTNNFFGNKNIERYAYPMKSTTEAITLRNRILLNFEDALIAPPKTRRDYEYSSGRWRAYRCGDGRLSCGNEKICAAHGITPIWIFQGLQITWSKAVPIPSDAMSKASQQKSKEYLEKMGVKVWVNTLVQDYDGKTDSLKMGRPSAP